MNEQTLRDELGTLAALDGVKSCAMVDSQSGLVWHAAGKEAVEQQLWEAAVDYWRLHRRSCEHFTALGDLGAALLHHRKAVLAIIPCAAKSELLVVCIASHQGVDWLDWQRRIRAMGARMHES